MQLCFVIAAYEKQQEEEKNPNIVESYENWRFIRNNLVYSPEAIMISRFSTFWLVAFNPKWIKMQ